jgi:hypothetical protein
MTDALIEDLVFDARRIVEVSRCSNLDLVHLDLLVPA